MSSTAAQRTLQRACSERELQEAVIELAQRLGYLVFHAEDRAPDAERGDYRQHERGFPDLVLTKVFPFDGARVLFLEIKRQNGKLSRDQLEWFGALTVAAMGDSSVRYAVIRPSDWQNGLVDRLLKGER